MRRLLVMAGVMACGLLATAAPAWASWAPQNTPNPAGAAAWSLSAVSCPTAGGCEAVGTYSDGSGQHLLAEAKNGSTWTIQTIQTPAGGSAAQLNAIACRSMSACVAVGSFFDGTNTVALDERWNGSTWIYEGPPNPAGATTTTLSAITCTTTAACLAVGSSYDGTDTVTLAESWNGTSWTIRSTPSPSGSVNAALNGIACTSATACVAVGQSSNATGTVTLAETWNGTSWVIQTTPNPTGATFSALNDVSCSAVNACMAVGQGFSERWNGATWTVQKTITPPMNTGGGADLVSVACATPTWCSAVGSYYDDAVLTLVAETWNNGNWYLTPAPIDTANDSSALSSLSCFSNTDCTAVGSYHDPVDGERALAELQILRWQLQSAVAPPGSLSSSLSSISCVTLASCQAVGLTETASDFEPVVESWNGAGWTLESTPNPSTSTLSGVSCSAATACTTVGNLFTGTVNVPLAERFAGSSWSAQTMPVPAGAVNSYLLGVSCWSATGCTAVGEYVDGSASQHTLAESWNGTVWTLQSTPTPSGTMAQLAGVSCTSASACTAVGSVVVAGQYHMIVQTWNGTSWTPVTLPTPGGGPTSFLSGVSCWSKTGCTAVGDYSTGSQIVGLAEVWNGTTWTAYAAGGPSGAQSDQLAGVSCKAANWCEAVGSYRNAAGTVTFTLREHFTGTSWTAQGGYEPTGAGRTRVLTGVSCPGLLYCAAAGWYEQTNGDDNVLAEAYF